MIGDSKYDTLEWEIKDDMVEIREKQTKKVVMIEEPGSMVDYAFRHTDYPSVEDGGGI